MKQTAYLLILAIACYSTFLVFATDYHTITIKNLSPAQLTITAKNDPDNPTKVIIEGNDTGSILVSKPKLNVHIEANYDGRILKTNFKRKNDHENYWEISIRKAIIGGIQLLRRESKTLN